MSNQNFKAMMCLKILFVGMSLFMAYLAITTSLKSNMFIDGAKLMQAPWFTTTLVDFYFNITIISSWVFYKEHSKPAACVWILSFILLGSIATSFYVFLQLLKIKEGQGLEAVLLKN